MIDIRELINSAQFASFLLVVATVLVGLSSLKTP
jgi:hypothetical protein